MEPDWNPLVFALHPEMGRDPKRALRFWTDVLRERKKAPRLFKAFVRSVRAMELILQKTDAAAIPLDALFELAYRRLADGGKVDAFGGMESRRVFREWIEAGRPPEVDCFIQARTNRPY